jgi:hypothetical protein
MEYDENGNPIEKTPGLVDKLAPCQAMHRRRASLKMRAINPSEPFTLTVCEETERQMFIDALEYVEVYSEDVFARIMAREALGKR